MAIDRTAKLGLLGTGGVIAISLGTVWLIRRIEGRAIASGDISAVTIWIAVIGAALALLFLFVIINEFIEVKLEGHGLTNPDE